MVETADIARPVLRLSLGKNDIVASANLVSAMCVASVRSQKNVYLTTAYVTPPTALSLHPLILVPPCYDRCSVNVQIEVPLLARRPTPAVIHNRAVEFGTVSDEKKAFGVVSLINKGSRKAAFSITWDKTLPLIFSPSEVRR